MESTKKRYYFIDAIRGIAMISMVLYHFMFDVKVVYGHEPYWYSKSMIYLWQQSICITFILIAGISWQWGSNHLKRGILLNIFGFIITIVTVVAMPSGAIWFGILNFMGCATLLMIPLHKMLHRIPSLIGVIFSMLCFLFFRDIQGGYLGIGGIPLLTIPRSLYDVKALVIFGLPFPGFTSSDYFPLLPWFFLFMTGYFITPIIKSWHFMDQMMQKKVFMLSVIGQKSIWVYMIHQPISMLICIILFG